MRGDFRQFSRDRRQHRALQFRYQLAVVRKNEIPLLRSVLHKAIFVMQAAERGSLRDPVSERQHVSVLVGWDRIRHGLRQTGA
jgi:hypothetical protein